MKFFNLGHKTFETDFRSGKRIKQHKFLDILGLIIDDFTLKMVDQGRLTFMEFSPRSFAALTFIFDKI